MQKLLKQRNHKRKAAACIEEGSQIHGLAGHMPKVDKNANFSNPASLEPKFPNSFWESVHRDTKTTRERFQPPKRYPRLLHPDQKVNVYGPLPSARGSQFKSKASYKYPFACPEKVSSPHLRRCDFCGFLFYKRDQPVTRKRVRPKKRKIRHRPRTTIANPPLLETRTIHLGALFFLLLLSCVVVWFIDIREHNRLMHALHGNGTRLVERMYDGDIPKLKKTDADASSFLNWSLDLAAWCAINGSTLYIIGPLPRPADADAAKQADGLRYLCACLEDPDMRSAVAAEARGSGPRGYDFLKAEYLQGQAEQPIFQGMLDKMAMKPGENPTAFKIKWRKIANALNPQPAERILSEKFMHAISRDTKEHYEACVTAASGSADLNDFNALSAKLAQLCSLKNGRDQKIAEEQGQATTATAMQARLTRLEQKLTDKEKGLSSKEKGKGKGGRQPGRQSGQPGKPGRQYSVLCIRCGEKDHTRKDCTKPPCKCTFSFNDGSTCGGDHLLKYCWYKDPSKARNPKVRELVEKRLADDKTSSASGHNAGTEDIMTFSGFVTHECPTSEFDAVTTPKSYRQALNSPQADYWREAIAKELGRLLQLGTMKLMPGHMASYDAPKEEPYLLVDTGASNHIINDPDCVKPFLDFHRKSPVQIQTGIGCAPVQSVGPAAFMLTDDQGKEHCIIRNVLYAPTFKENLFSPGKEYKQNGTVTLFDPDNILTLKEGIKIPISRKGNCFHLKYSAPSPTSDATVKAFTATETITDGNLSLDKDGILRLDGTPPLTLPVDMHLWHRRLGHATFGTMAEIQKQSVGIKCPNKASHEEQHNCHICPLSGMKAAPHKQNPKQKGERVEKYGDRIFMDLAGPLPPAFQGGERYLSIFVDEKTLHIGGYAIRYKSEQTHIHRRYVADHADIGAMNIRSFHSDNGGEYIGGSYIDLIQESGAKKTTIVARAPNMNGVAEAAFWRIFTAVRAMLLDSGMPKCHWAAAAKQAIYIFNRTPKRGTQPSPYEILRGRKPDLTPLRIFGCLMHSLIDKTERGNKLNAVARTGFHCGIAQAQRGWLMYIPGQDKYLVTRNARFDEHILFRHVTTAQTTIPEAVPQSYSDDEDEQRPPAPLPQRHLRCRTTLGDGSQCALQHFHLGACQGQYDRPPAPSDQRPSSNLRKRPAATPAPQPSPASDSPTAGVGEGQMAQSTGVEPTEDSEYSKLLDEVRAADVYDETDQNTNFGYVATTKQVKDSSGKVISMDIPKGYHEMLSHPDKKMWQAAMDEEYNSHLKNGTWKLVPAAEAKGRRIVGSTWAYDVKRNADGSINRYKARFCAQGFSQIEGLDYHITYSNTVRYETFRLLLAIAVAKGYTVTSADIKTAYLYGMLKETIYMRQAKGYEVTSANGSPMLCQLIRSIYGLKQSGACWETRLRDELHKIGFENCVADPCIYRINDQEDANKEMFLLVYVDDLCMATSSDEYRSEIWSRLTKVFDIKDAGPLTWILGTNVNISGGDIKLSQELYIEDLTRTFLSTEKMGKIPTVPCDDEILGLTAAMEGESLHPLYRSAIGKLGWLTVMTRPDIAYATSVLARFNAGATQQHMNLVLKLIKYLYKTKHYKLCFTKDAPTELYTMIESNSTFKCDYASKLLAFSDSSHGGEKPMCGYVILYNGIPISWHAGRLKHTSLSSAEGEYIVATQATVAIKALKDVMDFILRMKTETPTVLFCDNKAAVLLSDSNTSSKRLKHIATRIAFLREAIAEKVVILHHISTHGQIGDIFTKPLGGTTFHGFRQHLLQGVG